MPGLIPPPVIELFKGEGTFNSRLDRLHQQLLRTMPNIQRIACAIYDYQADLLKTFVNSTLKG